MLNKGFSCKNYRNHKSRQIKKLCKSIPKEQQPVLRQLILVRANLAGERVDEQSLGLALKCLGGGSGQRH